MIASGKIFQNITEKLKEKYEVDRAFENKDFWDKLNTKGEAKERNIIVDNSDINAFAKKIIPSNYVFSRNNKASSDLGTLKNKIIMNIKILKDERFSYLSLLAEYRKEIEKYVGISSKGIKINGLRILILKSNLPQTVDGWIAYKYCPTIENVSSSSKNNTFPSGDVQDEGEITEYANMVFKSGSSGDAQVHYFVGAPQRRVQINTAIVDKKFYVTYKNKFKESLLSEDDIKRVTSVVVAPDSKKGGNVNWIELSLTHTDNDVHLSFFEGEAYDYVGFDVEAKLVIDFEVTIEDFIQNVIGDEINNVLLRDMLVSRNTKYLRSALEFSTSVKTADHKLTTYFKDALNNAKSNKSEILLFNKFKAIYKSFVSMGAHGVSKSSLSKFIKIMSDGNILPYRFVHSKSKGVVSNLIRGINYDDFVKIIKNLQQTIREGNRYSVEYLPSFLANLINIGSMPLYLGDDKTYTGNVTQYLVTIPSYLYSIDQIRSPLDLLNAKKQIKETNRFNPGLQGPMAGTYEGGEMNLDLGNVENQELEYEGDYIEPLNQARRIVIENNPRPIEKLPQSSQMEVENEGEYENEGEGIGTQNLQKKRQYFNIYPKVEPVRSKMKEKQKIIPSKKVVKKIEGKKEEQAQNEEEETGAATVTNVDLERKRLQRVDKYVALIRNVLWRLRGKNNKDSFVNWLSKIGDVEGIKSELPILGLKDSFKILSDNIMEVTSVQFENNLMGIAKDFIKDNYWTRDEIGSARQIIGTASRLVEMMNDGKDITNYQMGLDDAFTIAKKIKPIDNINVSDIIMDGIFGDPGPYVPLDITV